MRVSTETDSNEMEPLLRAPGGVADGVFVGLGRPSGRHLRTAGAPPQPVQGVPIPCCAFATSPTPTPPCPWSLPPPSPCPRSLPPPSQPWPAAISCYPCRSQRQGQQPLQPPPPPSGRRQLLVVLHLGADRSAWSHVSCSSVHIVVAVEFLAGRSLCGTRRRPPNRLPLAPVLSFTVAAFSVLGSLCDCLVPPSWPPLASAPAFWISSWPSLAADQGARPGFCRSERSAHRLQPCGAHQGARSGFGLGYGHCESERTTATRSSR